MSWNGEATVLVVEDDTDLADLYSVWLSDSYDVRTAYNGDEAIELYDEDVDVVLLDRKMPDISGDEVLQDIRKLPGDCMAAMVTAVDPDYDIMSMEFEDYVQKPVTRDELLGVVERLLELLESGADERQRFELESKSTALSLNRLAEAVTKDEPSRRDLFEGLTSTVSAMLSAETVAVWKFDDGFELSTVKVTQRIDASEAEVVLEDAEEFVWDIYSGDKSHARYPAEAVAETVGVEDTVCLGSRLGDHGVLLSFVPSVEGISDDDEASVCSAAAMVERALDTVRYRTEAKENRRLSEEYRKQKTELARVNRMVRETTTAVLGASTRTEIERETCRHLVSSESVEFVWIGDYVESGNRMVGRYSTDDEYMETVAENGEMDEARKTAQKRKTVLVESLHTNPPLAPWKEQAARHGFGSVVRVPIEHSSSFYGVLSVYTKDDRVSHELVSALEDIADVVGHGIESYEAKTSLISDEVTDVRLRVTDPSFPPVRFAAEADAEISFEGLVPTDDGSLRTYINVGTDDRDTEEAVETAAERIPAIRSYRHIARRNGKSAFEFTGDGFFLQEIIDHGGVPIELEASPDSAEISIELPRHGSASSFVSMVRERYHGVELVSTRDRRGRFESGGGFVKRLEDELTDRQLETVQTAYYSGYFNSPRESTGQDIADRMGVSQPTVTENIKAAERKLFRLIFEGT